jgi:L-iditol 2-dehydrogenase
LLHKIHDSLSYEEATLIEPMAVATYAILERTRIEPEDFVVILGCGPIALLALQIIKAEGASKVAIVGLDSDEEFRFKIAKDFGVDFLINTQKDNVVETIYEATGGRGSDIVIDLTGSEKAIIQGFSLLKKDGKFCAIGLPYNDVSTPWTYLALKAATIIFSYSSNYKSWERCLSMIENNKVKLKQFTNDRYPLDKWEEAFKKARTVEVLKVIINP